MRVNRGNTTPALLPRGSTISPEKGRLADNSRPVYSCTDFRLARSSDDVGNVPRNSQRNKTAHLYKGNFTNFSTQSGVY